MFKIGDKVTIISDNENYEPYLGKVLVVENISTSEQDTCIFDSELGEQLMDFTIDGKEFPMSLYEYEIEKI